MHTTQHVRLLRAAADRGIEEVDRVTQIIQEQNPEAFHTEEALPTRVFHHQPTIGIPCVRSGMEYFRGLGIVR